MEWNLFSSDGQLKKNASVRMELNYKISVTNEHFVCKAPVSFQKYCFCKLFTN